MDNFIKQCISTYQLSPFVQFFIETKQNKLVDNYCQFDENGDLTVKPEYEMYKWTLETDFNHLRLGLLQRTKPNHKSIVIILLDKQIKYIENVDRYFDPNSI